MMTEQDNGQDNGNEESQGTERSGRPRSGAVTAVVAWIALVVAALALAGGFYLEKEREKLKDRIADLRYELRETESELLRRDTDFVREEALRRLERDTSTRLDELRERVRALGSDVEAIDRRTEGVTADWLYAEIAHVLTLASWHLEMERNPAPALAALRAAERRLRDSGLPGASRIIARISRDIAALEQVEVTDRFVVAMTLDGIANRVDDLPLLQPEGVRTERERARVREDRFIDWSALWRRIRQSFHSMVTVRRGERPAAVLLPPEQEYFVYLNTKLKLEGARVALMRGDTRTFRASLRSTRDWLEAWFDTGDSTVAAVMEELRGLERLELDPDLPDLDQTIRMLGGGAD